MSGALAGFLVVSLEQAVAAPLASFRLSESGARVIKIERPEGDFARGYDRAVAGESSYFAWLNRGKESLVLDIKDPDDAALMERMIGSADVFIQNLAPGAAARSGFGSADLRARYPRLVTCDISGYGESGPYSVMKAYDLLIQAETGLASVTGSEDAPGRVGISICDIAAGTTAYAAILEALLRRSRTGQGEGVSISLFDVMAEWMSVPLLHRDYGAGAPKRIGLRHPSIAPYGAYATDGAPVLVSIQNEREWQKLRSEVVQDDRLDAPDYSNNAARVANRAALDAIIAEQFLALPRGELIARLDRAGIAYGSINDIDGLSAHPALRRVPLAGVEGIAMVASPVCRSSGTEDATAGRVPSIGEHGAAIRAEFAADVINRSKQ
jgi:crotonobetainyl-CoA:carnitine CoA-transferase CaiB-like acyl-CoA transferase